MFTFVGQEGRAQSGIPPLRGSMWARRAAAEGLNVADRVPAAETETKAETGPE